VRRLASFAAALLLFSCSGPETPDRFPTPEEELLRALGFVEARADGAEEDLDDAGHLAEIDYESALRVTPAAVAVRRIAGASSRLPPEKAAERDQLEAITRLADSLSQARDLESAARAALVSARAREAAGESAKTDVAATRALLERESKLRLELLDHFEALVRAGLLREQPDLAGEPLDLAIGTRMEELIPDDAKLDYEKVGLKLNEEMRDLRARVDRHRKVLEEKGSEEQALGFRLRATLYSGEDHSPIHVENYDNLASDFSGKPPRLSFGSKADQERVAREVDAVRAVLDLGSEVVADELDLGPTLRTMRDQLKADLAALRGSLDLPAAGAGFGGLKQAVAAAKDDPALGRDDVEREERRAQFAQLEQLVADLEGVSATVAALAGRVRDASFADWPALSGEIQSLREPLERLFDPERAESLVAATELLGEWVAKKAAADARDAAEQQVAALRSRIESLRQRYAGLADFASLARARMTRSVARRGSDGVDEPPEPRLLDDLVPGTVLLHRTPADAGDQIDVTAELVRREGEEYKVTRAATRTFVVGRFGLVNQLSADAIFLKQSGDDHFRTAPAAAWTLHYRVRNRPDDSWLRDAWQLFDPGIGMSAAGISTDDDSFQPGIGGHLSFFHDILKAGYGYNLAADADRGYFFVGIGLFEALEGVGSLFGSGTRGATH